MNDTPERAAKVEEPQGTNTRQVVLVSGPIASGKTTLCRLMAQRFGFCVLSTRELLAHGAPDRVELQAAGASLDESTGGRWVLDGLLQMQETRPDSALFAVDAVRTLDQIRWIKYALGESVVHVHLTATREILSNRYEFRADQYSYDEVASDQIEQGVSSLAFAANLVVDTTNQSPAELVEHFASYLGIVS